MYVLKSFIRGKYFHRVNTLHMSKYLFFIVYSLVVWLTFPKRARRPNFLPVIRHHNAPSYFIMDP